MTRFYLPPVRAAAVTPAAASSWHVSGEMRSRKLATDFDTDTPTWFTTTPLAITAGTPQNVAMWQHVSDPLPAQFLHGAAAFVAPISESQSGSDAYLRVVIRLVSGDGTTERAVLFDQTDTLEASSLDNSRVVDGFLVGAQAQEGDRLVVEWGVRHAAGLTGSWTARAYTNAQDTYTDHSGADNESSSTKRPWLQLDGDVFNPSTTDQVQIVERVITSMNNPAIPFTLTTMSQTPDTEDVYAVVITGTSRTSVPTAVSGLGATWTLHRQIESPDMQGSGGHVEVWVGRGATSSGQVTATAGTGIRGRVFAYHLRASDGSRIAALEMGSFGLGWASLVARPRHLVAGDLLIAAHCVTSGSGTSTLTSSHPFDGGSLSAEDGTFTEQAVAHRTATGVEDVTVTATCSTSTRQGTVLTLQASIEPVEKVEVVHYSTQATGNGIYSAQVPFGDMKFRANDIAIVTIGHQSNRPDDFTVSGLGATWTRVHHQFGQTSVPGQYLDVWFGTNPSEEGDASVAIPSDGSIFGSVQGLVVRGLQSDDFEVSTVGGNVATMTSPALVGQPGELMLVIANHHAASGSSHVPNPGVPAGWRGAYFSSSSAYCMQRVAARPVTAVDESHEVTYTSSAAVNMQMVLMRVGIAAAPASDFGPVPLAATTDMQVTLSGPPPQAPYEVVDTAESTTGWSVELGWVTALAVQDGALRVTANANTVLQLRRLGAIATSEWPYVTVDYRTSNPLSLDVDLLDSIGHNYGAQYEQDLPGGWTRLWYRLPIGREINGNGLYVEVGGTLYAGETFEIREVGRGGTRVQALATSSMTVTLESASGLSATLEASSDLQVALGRSLDVALSAAADLQVTLTVPPPLWVQAVETLDPYGWWRLDDVGTTAADSSGNGHPGAYTTVTWMQQGLASLVRSDPSSPSMRFTFSTGSMTVAGLSYAGVGVTYAETIHRTTSPNSSSKWFDAGADWALLGDGGDGMMAARLGGVNYSLGVARSILMHPAPRLLLYRVTGTHASLWLDGVKIAEVAHSAPATTLTQLTISGGAHDELVLVGRAVSDAEVAALVDGWWGDPPPMAASLAATSTLSASLPVPQAVRLAAVLAASATLAVTLGRGLDVDLAADSDTLVTLSDPISLQPTLAATSSLTVTLGRGLSAEMTATASLQVVITGSVDFGPTTLAARAELQVVLTGPTSFGPVELAATSTMAVALTIVEGPLVVTITAVSGLHLTGVTPATVVIRWVLRDTVTGETWTMPINPDLMGSPFPRKQFKHGLGWRRDGRLSTFRGPSPAVEWEWAGVIRTKEHYDRLAQWAAKSVAVDVTDHLSRTFRIYITEFNPVDRSPTPRVPWRLRYTMKARILERVG